MIELLVIYLLCKKISQQAQNNGRSPGLHIFITIILWFGLEFIGFTIGLSFGVWYVAYIFGILFAALGGLIAYFIASHSNVDYTPRSDYSRLSGHKPRESYLSDDYFTGTNMQQISHGLITIVRESGRGSAAPGVFEFFLNGRNVGGAEDGSSITVPTGNRSNVLVARGPGGALSPPFEFYVEKGRHSRVLFREGRFLSAKAIGRMSVNG